MITKISIIEEKNISIGIRISNLSFYIPIIKFARLFIDERFLMNLDEELEELII